MIKKSQLKIRSNEVLFSVQIEIYLQHSIELSYIKRMKMGNARGRFNKQYQNTFLSKN